MTMFEKNGGSSGATSLSGRGEIRTRCISTSSAESPGNGVDPDAIS